MKVDEQTARDYMARLGRHVPPIYTAETPLRAAPTAASWDRNPLASP